jgi:hypothetical protein
MIIVGLYILLIRHEHQGRKRKKKQKTTPSVLKLLSP